MKVSSLLRSAAATALVVAGTAQASVITTDQWYYFSFTTAGSALAAGFTTGVGPIVGVNTTDGSWNITLSSAAELFWTDLQIAGDRFEFFSGATSLGTSGADVPGGANSGSNIAFALGDARFGKGSAVLAAGSHTLTGTFLGVIGGGHGAFIVRDLTVPAPTTTALVGLALAGLGLLSRRRAA